MAAIVKEEFLDEVRQEAEEMHSHFQKLSASVARARPRADAPPSRAELELSAEAVHAWLSRSTGQLRWFMSASSVGGLFFVAQCHEAVARGFVQCGGGSLESMKAAAGCVAQMQGGVCQDAAGSGSA